MTVLCLKAGCTDKFSLQWKWLFADSRTLFDCVPIIQQTLTLSPNDMHAWMILSSSSHV